MRRGILFFLSVLVWCMPLLAKTEKVKGTYTFYAPPSMSMQEAEQEAIRRAQLKALADHFGRVIVENTTSVLTEQDEHFYQVGNSLVKGEWIETIGTPKIERGICDDGFYVTCTIEGKAREIVSSKTDVEVKVLCNNPNVDYEHTDFKAGDKLYVSFKTPEEGFIAIYLYDKEDDKVMCMLPYPRDTRSANAIEKDKQYVFFSKSMNVLPARAKEYKMGCNESSTVNTLYILFSKKKFTKPMLKSEENIKSIPYTSYEKFQKWLTNCQTHDETFLIIKKNIKITKE